MSVGPKNQDDSQWSIKYDKEEMTFRGKVQSKNINILIDTGSFITIIDKKVLKGLSNIRKASTSLKYIYGIENVPKPVLGAVMVEIKVEGNILLLKCLVI